MQYYYFAASLPAFFWSDKPPLSVEDFLRQCHQHLSARDFVMMDELIKDKNKVYANNTANRWAEFKHNLRNERVIHRAKKYGFDAGKCLHGQHVIDMNVIDLFEYASEAENPLAAEKIIDQALWTLLDDLVQGHFFDIDFLIVYGLKLRIAERYSIVGSEKGKEKFAEIQSLGLIGQANK